MAEGDSRLEYRLAGRAEVEALVDLRIEFMRIVKDRGLEDEASWRAELSARFELDLGSGELVAWVCLDGARLVAASGLACPAAPARRTELGLGSGEGLVLNMYTLQPYRRRGIASELLRRSMEEARARGLTGLRLQPTDDGRPLYERAGFRDSGRDMVLDLRVAPGL